MKGLRLYVAVVPIGLGMSGDRPKATAHVTIKVSAPAYGVKGVGGY